MPNGPKEIYQNGINNGYLSVLYIKGVSMFIAIVASLIVGFVVGILFGRKNKNKVNLAVTNLSPIVDKLEGQAKEKLNDVLKNLQS